MFFYADAENWSDPLLSQSRMLYETLCRFLDTVAKTEDSRRIIKTLSRLLRHTGRKFNACARENDLQHQQLKLTICTQHPVQVPLPILQCNVNCAIFIVHIQNPFCNLHIHLCSRIYKTISSEILQSANFFSVSWPGYSFIKHLQWLFSSQCNNSWELDREIHL